MALNYPQARRRQPKTNRNSNAVRASVLETALELGITQNSTVANWIFNNPMEEEPEDLEPETENDLEPEAEVEESITPTLTHGSNTASDESSSPNSPRNNSANAGVSGLQVHMHKPSVTEPPHVHFGEFASEQLQLFSPLALAPPSPHPILKGANSGNLVGKQSRDTQRALSQDDSLRHSRGDDSPSPGPAEVGYSSEGQYLSKGKDKGKDKSEKKKMKKGSKPKALDLSKSDDRDTDYASDGGYLSAASNKSQGKSPSKGKSRAMAFFRRRPKKSQRGSDDEDEDVIPPVPALPGLPRPSSPKPLERRNAAPASPTRSGFTPLTLNFSSPPASPPRRRSSKSPPPVRVTAPQSLSPARPSDHSSSLPPPSPAFAPSTPVALTPAAAAATFPLPPSAPNTPLPTATFSCPTGAPTVPVTPSRHAPTSSRHHLSIPPPAPPPSLPLPQPPPSPLPSTPSTPSRRMLPATPIPSSPSRPALPSRRTPPSRPVPTLPIPTGPILTPALQPTQPLSPRKVTPPFRALPAPLRGPPPGILGEGLPQLPNEDGHKGNGVPQAPRHRPKSSDQSSDGDQAKAIMARQQADFPGSPGLAPTPPFLQRRVQHGMPPSPRHPPPDTPLPQVPPAPSPTPSARTRMPMGSPSKFHEHFSSVSSVPLTQIMSAQPSPSPTSSTARSGSSSGPSIRSSHTSSSTSERGYFPRMRDSSGTPDSRPATSASSASEVSYGQPITSSFARPPPMRLASRFSDRSEASLSVYPPTSRDSASAYDDDADVEELGKSGAADEDDDDASFYPSDEKTAGRRTMYLVEHGQVDENGDEIIIGGSQYWHGGHSHPPLPPLPPLPTHPGPGYF
ncbi:hypothetical protein HYDPIDRAFT_25783 [Hydnomerulius pinastri MD-312]|nr:hypothetical protein HYDPIDRAFT_25783 [Hydnomerulius pinastri MD-312]